ncbi:insulin-like growth factor-binding protein complex acid labile subunit isoform X1 [Aedes albopictus]|uniref:Uncharacterized protein n=1 Tax=Aedes albopictus TaxID=7160 RepID=A0ABM1YZY5_AEDAL
MLPIMMRICIIHFGFLSMLANALYIPDRSTTNAELNYRNMNITDFNFALVEVENLSSETLYINLEGNDLTSMPDNIAMYFSQMERIILNDNLRLSFPPDGSPFLRSPSLIELICERCGIHKIFTRSLRHLPHLEYLWLSDNQINQIAPYAFRRNQRLQNVDLSFNKLYTVPADMLKGLFRMKVLDLSNNPNLGLKNDAHFLASNVLRVLKCNYCGFTELYEETFSDLTNLKELHLEGNPILAIPYLRVPVVLIIRRGLQSSSDKNELYNSSGYRYSDWWWNGTVVYV